MTTYNTLLFNTAKISNGNFRVRTCVCARREDKYIIFNMKKVNLSNLLDKGDQLF